MSAVVPLKTSMDLMMADGNSRRSAARPPPALRPPDSAPLVFKTVMPSMSTRVVSMPLPRTEMPWPSPLSPRSSATPAMREIASLTF